MLLFAFVGLMPSGCQKSNQSIPNEVFESSSGLCNEVSSESILEALKNAEDLEDEKNNLGFYLIGESLSSFISEHPSYKSSILNQVLGAEEYALNFTQLLEDEIIHNYFSSHLLETLSGLPYSNYGGIDLPLFISESTLENVVDKVSSLVHYGSIQQELVLYLIDEEGFNLNNPDNIVIGVSSEVDDFNSIGGWENDVEVTIKEDFTSYCSKTLLVVGADEIGSAQSISSISLSGSVRNSVQNRNSGTTIKVLTGQIKNPHHYEKRGDLEVRLAMVARDCNGENPEIIDEFRIGWDRDDVTNSTVIQLDDDLVCYTPVEFQDLDAMFMVLWEYDWYARKRLIPPCSSKCSNQTTEFRFSSRRKRSWEWYHVKCFTRDGGFPNHMSILEISNSKCSFIYQRIDS